jgi:hypothetical protein
MHSMQRRFSPWLTMLAIAVLVCLVGCTLSLTVGPILPWPGPILPLPVGEYSRLDVLRTSGSPENHVPPFAATITDATKINRLLAAIEALPAYPGGIFCPLGLGIYDHLAFHSITSLVFQVDIDTGGCQVVYFYGTRQPPETYALGSPDFWYLFAQTLGVPLSTVVFPLPPPPYTGPLAPTPSS